MNGLQGIMRQLQHGTGPGGGLAGMFGGDGGGGMGGKQTRGRNK